MALRLKIATEAAPMVSRRAVHDDFGTERFRSRKRPIADTRPPGSTNIAERFDVMPAKAGIH